MLRCLLAGCYFVFKVVCSLWLVWLWLRLDYLVAVFGLGDWIVGLLCLLLVVGGCLLWFALGCDLFMMLIVGAFGGLIVAVVALLLSVSDTYFCLLV